MSSDSSSSSSEDHRRKRKHKKHGKDVDKKFKKSKKNKREKRHKEKKRSKQDEPKEQLPPQLPVPAPRQLPDPQDNADAFGPALPPHLLKEPKPPATTIIGPVMPSNLTEAAIVESIPAQSQADNNNDDDDVTGTFGPMPNATQVELEERALALKLAALEGGSLSGSTADQDVREEWMLELPEVGLKSGLAALNNMKRTFYQGKERPDFSDRSSWTKTPQSAAAGPKPCTSKDMEQAAQAKYERQRDEEQESIAKKHKKKHKRDESLVELHQKKLRKEQREREKELAASGSRPERRPFSRDVDLKLNKIDSNQTKQIVDKAKILNTKFSSGQAKYL
ncbi:GPALPP motifs-containing protein 1 [Drosophila innubila]|uniref:GPALPP motifs-containing protein 1 n=1 Tax=Drosophila innubila TaxID=198719 RepID=UPI00148CB435|nr:GPALPP motifs-containing protein 1 [Drosophila innubila]XP_034487568.1 GPALPP motifs-containing protein 1 [Drosophila innubila]